MRKRPGRSRRTIKRQDFLGRRPLVESLEVRQLFSARALDLTFGNLGVIDSSIAGGVVNEYAVAVQPDAKIVRAGTALVEAAPPATGYGAVELRVTCPMARRIRPSAREARAISPICPSGRLRRRQLHPTARSCLRVRYYTNTNALYGGFIVRFTSDGTLDSTFGNGGFLGGTLGSDGIGSVVEAISVLADGRIVAAVDLTPFAATNNEFSLERFNLDGTLDNSFGNAGVVNSPATKAYLGALAVESDGDIVVAGGSSDGLDVRKFDPTGKPIGSFRTFVLDVNGASGVLVENDGSVVVSGWAENAASETNFPFAMRLTDQLLMDPSFGQGGLVLFTQSGFSTGLVVQPNGKYVLGIAESIVSPQGNKTIFGLRKIESRWHPRQQLRHRRNRPEFVK